MFDRHRIYIFLAALLLLMGHGPASAQQTAKYIFIFIGDGMGVAQRRAAELFLASAQKGSGEAKLLMNSFPAQGINTTHDLSSFIPDSAAAGTAIATGFKTASGVIGMDAHKKLNYESIAETAKKRGWKVGILTTVSLNNATPAAFYAHVPSRKQLNEISQQLADSGFDYFAGGQLEGTADNKEQHKPNALHRAKANGYIIAMGRAQLEALKPGSGKAIAMNDLVDDKAAMYYTLDQDKGRDHIALAEYLAKGIEMLENPDGFLIMAEGGKIDWACHANDAASAIHDTLALDAAIAEAVKFYERHPRETLLVVTGDHETGGMALGFAETKYSTYMHKLQHQKMSHIEFKKKLDEFKNSRSASKASLKELLPVIKEGFGLYALSGAERDALNKTVEKGKSNKATEEAKGKAKEAEDLLKNGMALTDLEMKILEDAFKQSMTGENQRKRDDLSYRHYGGYEPLVVKLTTILDNKAGIGWTSFSHTAAPVQTSALGVGAELFNGYYDQTDIHAKIMKIAGFEGQ